MRTTRARIVWPHVVIVGAGSLVTSAALSLLGAPYWLALLAVFVWGVLCPWRVLEDA